jgi:peptidoglycan/xylan/chitin deacetylase (PgdA/CDA1 family)
MKAVALCYHDVVEGDDFDASGFPGTSPAAYKLDISDMARHLDAIAASRRDKPSRVDEFLKRTGNGELPLFITFDDGGVSAATHIADLLEQRGWAAHFFITAGRVDTPAFVSSAQVRELRRRGHLVGSHSWSHPTRMAHCSRPQLEEEWQRSVKFLSDVLGEQVDVASVPGGYYSRQVAEAAVQAGIRVLFNSEPQKTATRIGDCWVLGRYSVIRGMPADTSAQLACAAQSPLQLKQYLFWNAKKIVKRFGGRGYLAVREVLLRRRT